MDRLCSKKLYVGGISKGTTEQDLSELFRKHNVDGVVQIKPNDIDKDWALVEFESEQSASEAIIKLNKQKDKKGKEIAVSFYHDKVDNSLTYTISDASGYTNFIEKLRKFVAHHSVSVGTSQQTRLVLPEQQCKKQPDRWINVQIQESTISATTTLVIRDDNLYVKGFKNHGGKWFELCAANERVEEKLPAEYYPSVEPLEGWADVTYSSIMGLDGADALEKAKRTLETMRLGKASAERAVRRLSRYKSAADDDNSRSSSTFSTDDGDENPTRLGLAGLIVMICEAARMDVFRTAIGDAWDDDSKRLTTDRHLRFIWNWRDMSAALLKLWGGSVWDSKCCIDQKDAEEHVRLLLNSLDVKGFHGAQVEILAVAVTPSCVAPHSIVVFDDADNKHQIYPRIAKPHKAQQNHNNDITTTVPADKRMVPLKLNAVYPNKGTRKPDVTFSVYKFFSIQVKLPDEANILTRTWDCHEVVNGDGTELVTRTISLDNPRRQVGVTYLVLSNATNVTVVVKLRLGLGLPNEKSSDNMQEKDNGDDSSKKYSAQGEITAHIGGFEEHPIVLFRCEEPITLGSEPSILPLDRPVVQVPRNNKLLQICLKELHITETFTDDGNTRELKKPARGDDHGRLTFHNGDSSEVQVNVTWDNKVIEPTQVCRMSIGSTDDFTKSIDDLTRKLGDKTFTIFDRKNIWLTWSRATQAQRWIHVELEVKADSDGKRWTTTLAIEDGKCYAVGFLNQSQVWYELGNGSGQHQAGTLPPEYKSVVLGSWGFSYDEILGHTDDWDKVYSKLNTAGLGKKSFAEKAVRTLSRYPDVDEDDLKPRVALAGLSIMVCESARFNRVLEYFQHNWETKQDNDGTRTWFSVEEMKYIWSWGKISRALLRWKDNGHKWPNDDQTDILNKRRITDEQVALAAVRLVYSDARSLKFRPTPSGGSTTDGIKE